MECKFCKEPMFLEEDDYCCDHCGATCSIAKIKLANGEMFEGTLEMFKDCFFSNADHESISDFAEEHKVIFEIEYEWTESVIEE